MRERKPNEIGAGWNKENDHGKYISIALDLKVLVEMAGGVVDSVNINLYPITSTSEKAPNHQLKYFPKRGSVAGGQTPPPARPLRSAPSEDDDIPF